MAPRECGVLVASARAVRGALPIGLPATGRRVRLRVRVPRPRPVGPRPAWATLASRAAGTGTGAGTDVPLAQDGQGVPARPDERPGRVGRGRAAGARGRRRRPRRPPRDGRREHFAGSARKAAKTSFVSGAPKDFDSPGDLLDWVLDGQDPAANDATIRSKLNARSTRAPEEQRVVRVKAFLYATKKETDNDFHLLIGDDPR